MAGLLAASLPARADGTDGAIDAGIRRILASTDAAQEAAVAAVAAMDAPGSIAPLIHLLFWLDDDIHPAIGAALRRLTREPADAPGEDAFFDWMVWLQEHREFPPYAGYDTLLSDLLSGLDPQFSRFVRGGIAHTIRLEEIVWGGVKVDGIPALDDPAVTAAADARWLDDGDLVLGVELGGAARAYPLRILYWHEMVNDVLGGLPLSLPFCSLCGAGIAYDTRVPGGRPRRFGTSGLLYRSNKLMYDRETDSLWNQFTGEPVVGVLLGQTIALPVLPVTMLPWAGWRARHPATTVLSRQTGFVRDYTAGVPYRAYLASPDLAFPARYADRSLPAKALVFGVRVPGGAYAWPLDGFVPGEVRAARVGLSDVMAFRAGDGGVRAYAAGGRIFAFGADGGLHSADGVVWRIEETALTDAAGARLARLPGHVAYWFAWRGAFGANE